MKKIVASVGLAALGVSYVQAAEEPYVSAEVSRPWSVAASLRGFYDDNINTASSGAGKQNVFGVSVSPKCYLNWQREQTTLGAGYMYTLIYYDEEIKGGTKRYDQNHTLTADLNHIFSERYRINVTDSFAMGQEPDVLRAKDAISAPQRIPGDNIRNYGTVTFDAQLLPLFGFQLGYANGLTDYQDHNAEPVFDGSGNIIPSHSGSLDRIEHTIHLDGRWQAMPQTVGVVGYQYAQADFTGNELIGTLVTYGDLKSDARNSRSHYGYVGLDHVFSPELSGSVRLGVRATDSYNAPTGGKNTSPYASGNLSYAFSQEGSLQIGFSYDWNATDVTGVSGDTLTLGQESANVFASVSHRLLPHLYGSVVGQVQQSTLVGGGNDGDQERFYLLGLNLQYRLTKNLSAEAGYDFDKLDSELGRNYDRNRFYLGITGSY
jgi:hypothetical protein